MYPFEYVRATEGGVNFDSDGNATTQWYYFNFWEYLGTSFYDEDYIERVQELRKSQTQDSDSENSNTPNSNASNSEN
jgi:hypothetical protein